MVLLLRWSPYMKSFKGANVISAAIHGSRIKVVRELISRFSFVAELKVSGKDKNKLRPDQVFKVYGKDFCDNNMLHNTYIRNLPEVRQILRSNNLMPKNIFGKVANRMNMQG